MLATNIYWRLSATIRKQRIKIDKLERKLLISKEILRDLLEERKEFAKDFHPWSEE